MASLLTIIALLQAVQHTESNNLFVVNRSIMDVVKSNFAETLPAVAEAIEAAEFMAMDLEFTGLTADWKTRSNPLDTIQVCVLLGCALGVAQRGRRAH